MSLKHRSGKLLAYTLLLSAATANSCVLAESGTASTSTATAKHTVQTKESESAYRLKKYVVPSDYNLGFEPDAPAGKFTGKESILLEIRQACTEVVLNGNDLTVSGASIKAVDDKSAIPLSVSLQKNLQRITFHSPRKLEPGKYELSCSFKGILNDQLRGFYRSTFKDKAGKTHYLAVTQMEPADARRMFPAFDEPAFKASFKIKAIIPANNTAISNAPVEKESIDKSNGKKVVEFEKSPPMSSYLLALLIGEFKATEPAISENIPIRVWSVQHDPAMGNYTRDKAAKLLTYLNGYFRIPYPWKKLDLIAIPDFQAGAMENPGAITFREKFLILDEKQASLSSKQNTVSITAHEMAHLWFGDLVTMKWWDDIWLNEAFATWMATKAVDNVMPEWNVMAQFFVNRSKALYTDSLHSTRSIQAPVLKPEDAEQMFDEITYVKGAAVLRMLEHYLGEKTFQDGVSNYLKEHSFSNAATNDLWKALAQASQKPVKDVMDSWCNQPGYPLLQVSELSRIGLNQLRFFLDGGNAGNSTWKIPVGYRELLAETKADSFGREEISPEYQLMNFKLDSIKAKPEVVYANGGGFGFYRVLYAEKIGEMIASKLQLLSPVERLCFLSDQTALATAGKIPVERLLKVLRGYNNETECAVWETVISTLKTINRFVEPNTRPAFSNYIKSILQNEYKRLGWESTNKNESAPTRLLRGEIISLLGTIGQDKEVITKSREKFAQYLKIPDSVDSDLLDAISEVVAYNGTEKDMNCFKELRKKASTPELEQRALYAMAHFKQSALVEKALNLTISKEVRAQDAPKLLAEFFNEDEAKSLAWNFMKTHWTQIQLFYSPHMLSKLAEAPATLTDEKELRDLKLFFDTHKIPHGSSSISRMLEKLSINVQFKKRSGKELNKWLQQNN